MGLTRTMHELRQNINNTTKCRTYNGEVDEAADNATISRGSNNRDHCWQKLGNGFVQVESDSIQIALVFTYKKTIYISGSFEIQKHSAYFPHKCESHHLSTACTDYQ